MTPKAIRMFSWLKSKGQKTADNVLAALDVAEREIDPRIYIDPLDGALMIQPRLVLLNSLLGRESTFRFWPVKHADLVQRAEFFSQKGLLDRAVSLVGGDSVVGAVFSAAVYEHLFCNDIKLAVRRAEILVRTEEILRIINFYSEQMPEAAPSRSERKEIL